MCITKKIIVSWFLPPLWYASRGLDGWCIPHLHPWPRYVLRSYCHFWWTNAWATHTKLVSLEWDLSWIQEGCVMVAWWLDCWLWFVTTVTLTTWFNCLELRCLNSCLLNSWRCGGPGWGTYLSLYGNNFDGQFGVTFKLSLNDVALAIALVRRRLGQEHFETPC